LTKLGTYIVLRRVWNPIDFQGQRSRGQIFTILHPCEHSRINILQWILTKLGTYLDLRRIWNHIDFQGQRSRSQGLIFRRGDMPRFALPLFNVLLIYLYIYLYFNFIHGMVGAS
jgi:hypothetical protein